MASIIAYGSHSNWIGTDGDGKSDDLERNVISANSGSGIVSFPGAWDTNNGNTIAGNYIGTDATGTVAMGNAGDGIRLDRSANTVIGGTTEAERNVVAANGGYGIWVRDFSSNTSIQGNFLGTDASGTGMALGNYASTIYVEDSANTTIGGSEPGAGNVISGSQAHHGIYLRRRLPGHRDPGQSDRHRRQRDAGSGQSLRWDLVGLRYDTAFPSGTQIGGTSPQARNIISNNGRHGDHDRLWRRQCHSGELHRHRRHRHPGAGQRLHGIYLLDSPDNLIGGNVPGSRNIISANANAGVEIECSAKHGQQDPGELHRRRRHRSRRVG